MFRPFGELSNLDETLPAPEAETLPLPAPEAAQPAPPPKLIGECRNACGHLVKLFSKPHFLYELPTFPREEMNCEGMEAASGDGKNVNTYLLRGVFKSPIHLEHLPKLAAANGLDSLASYLVCAKHNEVYILVREATGTLKSKPKNFVGLSELNVGGLPELELDRQQLFVFSRGQKLQKLVNTVHKLLNSHKLITGTIDLSLDATAPPDWHTICQHVQGYSQGFFHIATYLITWVSMYAVDPICFKFVPEKNSGVSEEIQKFSHSHICLKMTLPLLLMGRVGGFLQLHSSLTKYYLVSAPLKYPHIGWFFWYEPRAILSILGQYQSGRQSI